jgi:hypothetical protein
MYVSYDLGIAAAVATYALIEFFESNFGPKGNLLSIIGALNDYNAIYRCCV